MRPLKITCLVPLVVFSLLLVGCGSDEPAPPPNAPTGAKAPEPAVPKFPKELDVDFASLAKFPDLTFEAIGTIPEEGDPRAALMDGAPLTPTTGQPANLFWVAKPAAQFIVNLPTDKGPARVDKVTVEDGGGDRSFPFCSVSVETPDKPTWHPPMGLTSRKEQIKTPEGEWVRTIIQFDEVQSIKIRVSFPAGNAKQPDRVFVRDIDIIGDLGG